MVAGYATVSSSDWTIVALKPTKITLLPLSSLILKVLRNSLPFAILTLFLAWFLSRLIALPLWQLARKASRMDIQAVASEINGIRSWYYESSQIKRAMLIGISLLHDKIGRLKYEVQTDPLTSLLNRRGLSMVLEYFIATKQSFAVLALDIDHFKRVNDTWGHDMGDQVIQNIAEQLKRHARQSDIVCRNGGEEFLMILPGTNREATVQLAELLRFVIANESHDVVGQITISVGVAFWHAGQYSVEQSFKWADEALYQAKSAGRNQVVVSSRPE
ncbi:MAG: Diguanylate cyclase DgcM [Candidatus Erwinia impunctatus]|nr:Diguanylate cyclase DgcM [Culicoides impunctatus]